MTNKLAFNCAATMIGSLPDKEPGKAWEKISKYLKDLPAWPQLPMRANLENTYIQYSEGFPGIVIDGQNISVDTGGDFDHALETLFSDSFEEKIDSYVVSKEYAAGLHYPVSQKMPELPFIKGQMIGPISWGLCVTDSEGRGIVYDDMLAEATAKFLKLKAQRQETFLRNSAQQTMIFVDEPYLSSLGSAFVALSNEQVSSLISEVLSGIKGLKGIHCCGNTDWSLLLDLPIDVLSFDAYNYADSILCYEHDLVDFINKGRAIAWGIVPNDEDTLKKESVPSLVERFEENIASLTRAGLSTKALFSQSLITPACGLASLSENAAEEVFNLLAQLSKELRRKYSHL